MERKLLYLEGGSGISGDMTVAALLDLGASEQVLRSELKKLPVDGYEIATSRTTKCGIDAKVFSVLTQETHHHRTFADIARLIEESQLNPAVKRRAWEIFYVLAKAEGKVHGVPLEEVHFHEVGAIDSIVDIVGAAICLEDLAITDVAIGTLTEGCGTIHCQHGEIPVPVPAVLELITTHGLAIKITDIKGEMITPTGAAIAAAIRTKAVLPNELVIHSVGIGAGTKDLPHANILRAMIVGEIITEDGIWVLETNVDDMSGEQLGFLQERILMLGIRDVFFSSIYMKKNRPAYRLTILCDEADIKDVEALIFRESTSIGIRRFVANRTVLERRMERVMTAYGEAKVKLCCYGGETFSYPEYEEVKALAKRNECSYREIYDEIRRKASELN
jgi:TIGR00299 family protein